MIGLFPMARETAMDGPTVRVRETRVAPGHEPALPPQGYELEVSADGVLHCRHADADGRHYAQLSAAQLLARNADRLPVGTLTDWPDYPVRGVMLDISRDKVPKLAMLKAIIRQLGALKFNHLQLYMEHTFAYRDHEAVHGESGAYSHADIAELRAVCRQHRITLAPNQNCLGHLERWLAHPRYAPLALAPRGSMNAIGVRRPPMTLDPRHPGSFALIAGLLDEIVPAFDADMVHIGMDETWELEESRLDELVDWVERLSGLNAMEGRMVLAWADMFLSDPDRLRRIRDHAVLCDWGYEADHDFDASARRLAEAGVDFWVCPGTSSWLSLSGRWDNALANCTRAAEAGLRHGASGFLLTDWGDNGHLQPWTISWPAIAVSAGASWCREANRGLDICLVLDRHLFGDATGGLSGALRELGNLYRRVTPQPSNMSALTACFYYPWFRAGEGLTDGLTLDELQDVRVSIETARCALADAAPTTRTGRDARADLHWVADTVELVVDDLTWRLRGDGSLSSVPDTVLLGLAERCDAVLARHRAMWSSRNRPQGLDSSARWFEQVRNNYQAGRAISCKPPRAI